MKNILLLSLLAAPLVTAGTTENKPKPPTVYSSPISNAAYQEGMAVVQASQSKQYSKTAPNPKIFKDNDGSDFVPEFEQPSILDTSTVLKIGNTYAQFPKKSLLYIPSEQSALIVKDLAELEGLVMVNAASYPIKHPKLFNTGKVSRELLKNSDGKSEYSFTLPASSIKNASDAKKIFVALTPDGGCCGHPIVIK